MLDNHFILKNESRTSLFQAKYSPDWRRKSNRRRPASPASSVPTPASAPPERRRRRRRGLATPATPGGAAAGRATWQRHWRLLWRRRRRPRNRRWNTPPATRNSAAASSTSPEIYEKKWFKWLMWQKNRSRNDSTMIKDCFSNISVSPKTNFFNLTPIASVAKKRNKTRR